MCHHFRRLSLWDSWAVTSWTVLFSYRGREAARNGITNSYVLTSASCVCLCACVCVRGHTLCDACRGFCLPSGYFFEDFRRFQETMIMFIPDTWLILMLRTQVATWQLVIFFCRQIKSNQILCIQHRRCCCQACRLLSLHFPPATGTWKQFDFNHSAFSLATSTVFPSLPGSLPGRTINTAGFVQVNKLWPISQLPLANLYRRSITF